MKLDAVKTWFTKRHYTEKTETVYRGYMDMFCKILNKTPDEFITFSEPKALEIQCQLANTMKKWGLRKRSIAQRINVLHGFWRANHVQVTEKMMKYAGTEWVGEMSFKQLKAAKKHEQKKSTRPRMQKRKSTHF